MQRASASSPSSDPDELLRSAALVSIRLRHSRVELSRLRAEEVDLERSLTALDRPAPKDSSAASAVYIQHLSGSLVRYQSIAAAKASLRQSDAKARRVDALCESISELEEQQRLFPAWIKSLVDAHSSI